jgi:cyclopropane-fatty-acyl-phospholipid synthase
MIEAVGHEYLPDYFATCSRLLKPAGKMLLQAITISDQVYEQYRKGVDFIQRHVFPGGCLVANRVMFDLIARKTDMVVRGLEDFGLDYARTLNDWRSAFGRSTDSLEHNGYDDRFRRLWNFYLAYCEGGFRERWISVVHLLATKPDFR